MYTSTIASLNDYIKDPARNYSGHYYVRLYSEPRKLDSVRYKHFVDIFNTLAPLNKQEEIDPLIMRRRQKEVLLGLERANLMTEKDKGLRYMVYDGCWRACTQINE